MKEGERMEHTFEKRKKVIYDLICDDLYVPMKLKRLPCFCRFQESRDTN